VSGVRHLYVHVPFCVHRCGYCDFVTLVGRESDHERYVGAVLAELALEAAVLSDPVETVFIGGGTPTFTAPDALARLLRALPAAAEVTVEANPETVTTELATLLCSLGVTRVSLGAQSFQPQLLAVLERRAGPDDVRRAVHTLRDAGFDNISLDLLYGIPGQGAPDLAADLAEALALAPEHVSYYELEAKAGTRFTHAWGEALEQQSEAMEGYLEEVVQTLVDAGYRWYETANFCLSTDLAGGRDLRGQHNLGYWRAHDYLGVGIGAVSTVAGRRWRNPPRLSAYVTALEQGRRPAREVELLDDATRARERLMLGLRLDDPVLLDAGLEHALDEPALRRLVGHGLVQVDSSTADARTLRLTDRGRPLGGGVTAELLA
jgi:oxygen-independent coproporphyrinogen-3 oxidase